MSTVFVTREIPEPALRMLIEAFGADEVEVYPHDQIIPRDELAEAVKGYTAVLTMLTEGWDAALFDAAGASLKVWPIALSGITISRWMRRRRGA